MKVNEAKTKMLAGQPAFGYGLGLGSPQVAEVLASSGIDFLLLDNQHGSFGPDSTIASLALMAHGTAVPMARVARNDYTMIGRLLDEGALGIVVPLVHTAEEAKMVADACRFPPRGARSWGWGHAAVYGDDYPDWIDDQLFVAVQIESTRAVDNAEAIMATPGIDGCWVGPADLALSFGIHPRDADNDDRHRRALERVIAACQNTGKVPGIAAGSVEGALRRAAEGFRYLVANGDGDLLLDGARAGVAKMRGGS